MVSKNIKIHMFMHTVCTCRCTLLMSFAHSLSIWPAIASSLLLVNANTQCRHGRVDTSMYHDRTLLSSASRASMLVSPVLGSLRMSHHWCACHVTQCCCERQLHGSCLLSSMTSTVLSSSCAPAATMPTTEALNCMCSVGCSSRGHAPYKHGPSST